jgi:hypothetical protein
MKDLGKLQESIGKILFSFNVVEFPPYFGVSC